MKAPSVSTDRRPKQRALWKGTLGFGLVNIPVELYRAVTPKRVRFHELHDEDSGRIQRRPVCARDGQTVPARHIVKGFEIDRGRYVQLLPAELAALETRAAQTIDIDAFVNPSEVDPIYHEATYYLAPGPGAGRGYALLSAAMESMRKAAIARTVMRNRQLLCVVRATGTEHPRGAALTLTILNYADEVVPLAELASLPGSDMQPTDRELALAERLVESRTTAFRPERYRDEHREKVLELIHQKATGQVMPPPSKPPQPSVQLDLVGALEASLLEPPRAA